METLKAASTPEQNFAPEDSDDFVEVINPPEEGSFAAKEEYATKIYEKLTGEKPSSDMSAAEIELYSRVDDSEDTSGFPKSSDERTIVTVFGIEKSGIRYPFNEETQKTAHFAVLEALADDTNHSNNLYENLVAADEKNTDALISAEQNRLIRERYESIREQAKRMRIEDAKPYKKNDSRNYLIRAIGSSYNLNTDQAKEVYDNTSLYWTLLGRLRNLEYSRNKSKNKQNQTSDTINRLRIQIKKDKPELEKARKSLLAALKTDYGIKTLPDLNAIEAARVQAQSISSRRDFTIDYIQTSYGLKNESAKDVYSQIRKYDSQRIDLQSVQSKLQRAENSLIAIKVEIEQLSSHIENTSERLALLKARLEASGIKDVPDLNEIENQRAQQFDMFIIQDGYMTEPELTEYKRLRSKIERTRRTLYEKISQINKHDPRSQSESIHANLNLIRGLIAKNAKNKWLDENPDEELKKTYTIPFDLQAITKKEEAGEPIPSIQELESSIRSKFPDNEDFINSFLTDWVDTCQRYYELVPKHRKAEVVWGSTPAELVEKTGKKIQAMKDDYQNYKVNQSYTEAKNNIDSLKTTLAQANSNEDFEKVFWLPTGFIGKTQEGRLSTRVISPLDSKILALIPDNLQKIWHGVWGQYDKKLLEGFNRSMRKELNQELSQSFKDGGAKPYEQHLYELSEQYKFELPPTINESNGVLNPDITEDSVGIIDEVIQPFSKYITGITTERPFGGYHNISAIQKQILDYLSGAAKLPPAVVYSDGKLNLAQLSFLADTASNLSMTSLVTTSIGLDVYSNLSSNLQEEYRALYPPQKTRISEVTFNRLYKRRIPSAIERRKLISRLLFASDFKKYINNKPLDQGVQEFFAKVL